MEVTGAVAGVRAVLLDIDDTLVDTRGAFRHALAVVGASHLPAAPDADALVAVWRTDSGGWYRAYTRGEVSYREQRMRRANELHERFGGAPLDDVAYDAWDEEFEAAFRDGWRAHEDAVTLVEALAEAGVPCGAVSNAAVAYQRHKLAAVGLEQVPMLVGTDTFGVGKPDPRVFLEGARLLGVEPTACMYVGDERDLDPVAALAAGLGVGVWIDRPGTRHDGHPGSHAGAGDDAGHVWRVETLTEVAAWFGPGATVR